jgi:hypothetical protein
MFEPSRCEGESGEAGWSVPGVWWAESGSEKWSPTRQNVATRTVRSVGNRGRMRRGVPVSVGRTRYAAILRAGRGEPFRGG